MLSWKTLSLIVAAAMAMNGVSSLEQGNTENLPKPSGDDNYLFDSTGSSVAGSSAIDEGSDSVPKGKGAFTIPPSTGSTSSSGSGSVFNPKQPLEFSTSGSGSAPGSLKGSQSEGSTGLDEGSDSTPNGVPSLGGSGSSPTGSTGSDEGSDYTTSDAGSEVEGSSAIDEGSDSVPKTGSGSVPTSSEGSMGLDEGSSSQPGSKGDSIEFPSASGSEANGSNDISQASSSQPTGKNGIPRSGDGGSEATTPSSESGSKVTGSSDTDESSDSNSPNQTDDSMGSKVAGSSATGPTFPSTGTSCKRRLRQ